MMRNAHQASSVPAPPATTPSLSDSPTSNRARRPRCGAQRRANRHLPPPALRAYQQQTAHVRRGNQQQYDGASRQHQKGGTNVPPYWLFSHKLTLVLQFFIVEVALTALRAWSQGLRRRASAPWPPIRARSYPRPSPRAAAERRHRKRCSTSRNPAA